MVESKIKTKFNGSNWRQYESEAKKYFLSLKSDYPFDIPYWRILTGEITLDAQAPEAAVSLWVKLQSKIALALVQSMNARESSRFCSYEYGTDIWLKLVSDYGIHQNYTASRQLKVSEVRSDYYGKSFNSKEETIQEHLDSLEKFKDDLLSMSNDQITEEIFIERVLSSIKEEEFKDLINQIRFTGDPLNRTSYQHLRSTLQAVLKSKGEKSKSLKEKSKQEQKSKTKETQKKEDFKASSTGITKCNFCGEKGHNIEQCFAMKSSREWFQQRRKPNNGQSDYSNRANFKNQFSQNQNWGDQFQNKPFNNKSPFPGQYFPSTKQRTYNPNYQFQQRFQNQTNNMNQNGGFRPQNPFTPPNRQNAFTNVDFEENNHRQSRKYNNVNQQSGEMGINNTLYHSYATNFSSNAGGSGNNRRNDNNNPRRNLLSNHYPDFEEEDENDDTRNLTPQRRQRVRTTGVPPIQQFARGNLSESGETISMTGTSFDLNPTIPRGNINIPIIPQTQQMTNIPFNPVQLAISPFSGNTFGGTFTPSQTQTTTSFSQPNRNQNIRDNSRRFTETSSSSSRAESERKRNLPDLEDKIGNLQDTINEQNSQLTRLTRNNNTMNVHVQSLTNEIRALNHSVQLMETQILQILSNQQNQMFQNQRRSLQPTNIPTNPRQQVQQPNVNTSRQTIPERNTRNQQVTEEEPFGEDDQQEENDPNNENPNRSPDNPSGDNRSEYHSANYTIFNFSESVNPVLVQEFDNEIYDLEQTSNNFSCNATNYQSEILPENINIILEDEFGFDTCDNNHIVTDMKYFIDYEPFTSKSVISGAGKGFDCEAKGKGTIKLITKNDHGDYISWILPEVVYTPHFKQNLFSPGQAKKHQSLIVEWYLDGECTLFDHNRTELLTADILPGKLTWGFYAKPHGNFQTFSTRIIRNREINPVILWHYHF